MDGFSGCGDEEKEKAGNLPTWEKMINCNNFLSSILLRRYYLPLFFVFIISFFSIAWILIEYTDSNVPWLDSFTTALSIVGMWMLARKYIEQWFAWILVDIVCCGLYIYKDLYFTSALYGLYSIIAIFGYFKWKRLMSVQ